MTPGAVLLVVYLALVVGAVLGWMIRVKVEGSV